MVCYAVRVTAVGGARCRCGCKKSGDIPGCGTGKMIVPRMEAEAASGLPPVTLQGVKRGILLVLLILNGILLPIGCVPALLVVNAVNPMAMAFVTDIHVINGLEEPIAITPIGTVGPDGKRSPLPMYASRFPVIPSDRSGGLVVDPGETVELLYDWDDINLSELVITFADGTTRQLVVDPQPTINQYRKPATNQFMISSPSHLEPVPPDVAAAGERAQRPTHLWLKVLPLFLPWITFYLLLKSYRRRRGGESDAGAAI